MAFQFHQTVRFQHCDPAGIVFYPRYFEMLNACVEAWCEERLGHSFAKIHGEMGLAVPTAGIEVTFTAPSRLEDQLTFELTVTRLGRTSVGLAFAVMSGGEERLKARSTLVCVSAETLRPVAWPEALRIRLKEEREDSDA